MRLSLRYGIALAVLSVPLASQAVSNRIFMSTNGNNASDCANPLTPCLTFAGALAQVNPGGEVIAEATGGYGALNVTQAVTISGPPGVVIYSGLPVTVNAPGATVVLRGLTIDGTGAAGNGISVTAVGNFFVESCVIANFAGSGSTGNGLLMGSPGNLFVKDTIVRGVAHVGIWVAPASGTAKAALDHCRLDGNQFGVVSDAGASTTIRDSVASGNGDTGVVAEFGGELNVESCMVSNQNFGASGFGNGVLSLGAGSVVRVSNTTVTDNNFGLFVNAGDILSRGNNTVEGNNTEGSFTGTYSAK